MNLRNEPKTPTTDTTQLPVGILQPVEPEPVSTRTGNLRNEPKNGPALSRNLFFAGLLAVSAAVFWQPLSALLHLSLTDDRYSHIALIPVVVAGIVYLEQQAIFRVRQPSSSLGGALLGVALLLHFGVAHWLVPSASLSVSVLAVVLAWTGAFLLCYGLPALRTARFPALFLLLMVPPPVAWIERVSYALQAASAEMSYALFRLLGVPVFRQGFVFALPNVTIEIAEQCSGIRSTIALVITGLLLGHLFLKSGRNKVLLVAFAAFVAVFKNAVRIVALAGAGHYFNLDLLNSSLHHRYGGTVFSLVALALIIPALLLFRRLERRAHT
jgi:exosortase